jgi:peptidoglycan hydrolase-like protein with peptidoglycan-binding domain
LQKKTGNLKKFVVSSAVAGAVFTAPMVAEAAMGDETLRDGMNHPDVKELQDFLKREGIFRYHTSTGYYGPITSDAVRTFQKEHGLVVDGIAGPNTFKAVRQEQQSDGSATGGQEKQQSEATPNVNPSDQNSNSNFTTLQIGSRGSSVTRVQSKLKEKGIFTYHTATGYFGTITEKAVRTFQQQNQLPVTGQVNQATYDLILRNQNSSDKSSTSPSTNESKAQPKKPSLTIGSQGDAVRELQLQLKQLNFFDYHTATGYYGEITASAVYKFQRAHQLKPTGVADTDTQNKVQEASDKKKSEPASFDRMELIADAAELTGTPYQWGGTTPNGFDCSGFLVYVFNKQGVSLPRTVAQIWNAGTNVSAPEVGDIVFFETYKPGPSHAGIYIGNNQFVHSGSSTGVTVSSMDLNYWSSRYLGAKRTN